MKNPNSSRSFCVGALWPDDDIILKPFEKNPICLMSLTFVVHTEQYSPLTAVSLVGGLLHKTPVSRIKTYTAFELFYVVILQQQKTRAAYGTVFIHKRTSPPSVLDSDFS